MSEIKPGSGSEPIVPYSASKHAIQGASENVTEAKDSVGKAQNSIKDLVAGKANMVDTALAVKGAIDNVKGLTGRLSATAMMPVLKALGAFKGQAILPAGKQMDPILGVDVHMVTIPPSPAPVPLPHPYIAMLFNPKDWVSCLINTFKQDALDTLPPPAEDDKGMVASVVKNKDAIASIAMGIAGMSASVKFGGVIPRAITGTKAKNVSHIPMGAGFHPGFAASVAKNHGKAFLGALFVVADGDPMVGSFHLNYDCWDVGVVDLFKSRRNGAKKAPEAGSAQAELYVPSGVIMPIPLGRPVLVNSIPTPINPLTILDKLFKAGLGKLKAAGRKVIQKGLDKLNGKVGCGPLTKASKLIGTGQSHPVDVAGGHFYTDNIDFSLPGPIPLSWERTWYSYSNYRGPLGYGWHHSYDMALAIDDETQKAILRMSDGRATTFDLPMVGKSIFNRSEKLTLALHEDGYYYVTDKKNLIYRFSLLEYRNPFNNTKTRLLQSVANRNGFAIRLHYDNDALLTKIIDSAGRMLNVQSDSQGRITNIQAPHPENIGEKFPITRYDYTSEGDMLAHTDALDQSMLFGYENHLMIKEVWRTGLAWNFRYDKKFGIDAKCLEVWGDNNLLHYRFDYSNPQCTLVTNSLGHKKSFFHKNGVVTKYIDPNGAIWLYRYNQYNELESESDPLGNQSSYSYDQWGNLNSVLTPDGLTAEALYLNKNLPFQITDAIDIRGGKWHWEYDEATNLITRANPAGAIAQFEYKDGLLCKFKNDLDTRATNIYYDVNYNPIELVEPNGATYHFYFDGLGSCKHIINPYNQSQKRYYDLNGRINKLIDYDNNKIELEYDGLDNITHYKDNKEDVQFTYKGFWKLTNRTEGGTTVSFIYDTEEQLVRIINEESSSYSFTLDGAGNVTSETGFDGITRTYERNAVGWVTRANRPGNKYTAYEYDQAGRITRVNYYDGNTEEYAYDKGSLISASNSDATVTLERDVIGDIISESCNGHYIKSKFDRLQRRISVASSQGANIAFQVDDVDNIIGIDANGWNSRMEYDKFGLEITRKLSGNLISHWQRDGTGKISTHTVENNDNPHTLPSLLRQYKWDVNFQIKQITDSRTRITRFDHDERGYLSKTKFHDGSEQFRIADAVGNLFETENKKDRKYDKGGRLIESRTASYKYDDEGFLIEKRESNGNLWKYLWNAAGKLIKCVKPDSSEVYFKYDPFGRRIEKKYKKTVTKWLWDVNKSLHEWKEFDLREGTTDDLITWVFDENSYTPAAKIKGTKKYSIIADHLGTPLQGYNEDGEVIWSRELDSYGRVRMLKGDEGFCNYLYQGQSFDGETGLVYNRFRYYSPDEGMYISQDPVGLRGGIRLYSYVKDTNAWIDPFGLGKKPPTRTVNDTEIVGTGQQTGGNGHATLSEKLAEQMANSGEYKKVGVNVAVSTVTGKSTDPKKRPDVTGVRHDGTVDIVEVPSPTDDLDKLKKKGKETLKSVGKRAGTYTETARTTKK